ncbi:MAG: ECF-type sigma factor [Blastocatellia bacterium]|nr:ECF-type sigma factor [Blastocatellia bacterium]
MAPTPTEDVTRVLHEVSAGDRDAFARLMPLVYDELRRLAARYLRRERAGHTLQPTALVNEAYLRLIDQTRVNWQNRAHFFSISAEIMRRILVDYARSHNAEKRGGNVEKLPIEEAISLSDEMDVDLIALDDALADLAKLDPLQSRVVELKFFGGLTLEETAEVLSLSRSTVEREWLTAKAWLYVQLSNTAGSDA